MKERQITKRDLIPVIYEYLLLVAPIAIYVGLETMHKHDWSYFFKSPEWGIATIFLSFQGVALYFKSLTGKESSINHSFLGMLFLFVVIVTIAAILNSYLALDHKNNTIVSILIRLVLLLFVSILFFILTLSGKYNDKI